MSKTDHIKAFSLVEAVIATAITSIGFIGVYTLVMYCEKSILDSIARQKLQMQANQMLDTIEADMSNIDSYNALNMTTCTDPGAGAATYLTRQYEWCQRMQGELGTASASDTRRIDITTLSDGRKVAHILLESNNGTVQIVMKRTYEN